MGAIPGDVIDRLFTTRKFADGTKFDATGTPTGTVHKNGVATGVSVTVANIATGLYWAYFTAAAGGGADQFAAGDDWALEIDATVDSVPDQWIVDQGTFDGARVSDLNNITAASVVTALFNNASMKQMLAFARGKVTITGGPTTYTVTFYDTDDTTPLQVFTVTASGRTVA